MMSELEARAEIEKLSAVGFSIVRVDCSKAIDKESFLAALSEAMHWSGGFGMNWDALYDKLRELGLREHRKVALILQGLSYFASASPDAVRAAVQTIEDAARELSNPRSTFAKATELRIIQVE